MSSQEQLATYPRPPFGYTQSPNPSWKPYAPTSSTPKGKEWVEMGDKVGWKTFHTEQEDLMKIYNLMKSGIVPRPIAFVSSVSPDGIENLAPYSFFNQVSSRPPIVSISISTAPRIKDTSYNIQTTKGYTVNIISEPWIEQADMASIDAPAGNSEWELTGLTKLPSAYVKAPRVKESAFCMECVFHQLVEITDHSVDPPNVSGHLVLGRVVAIHVRNDMFTPNSLRASGTILVDPERLMPVARMGDISYAGVGPGYRLVRKEWGKVGGTTEEETSKAMATGHANGHIEQN